MSEHQAPEHRGDQPRVLEAVPPPDDPFATGQPPHDLDAERGVLGAILLNTRVFHDVQTVLEGADFYRPAHELIYDAAIALYAAGDPVDAVTVLHQLTTTGDLARTGGAPYLHELISTVPTPENGAYYARAVQRAARLRRLAQYASKINSLTQSKGADVHAIAQAANEELAQLTAFTPHDAVRALNIDEFLDTTDPEYDWLIPDVLERGDRLIITGPEGGGKSTFLRQVAVQCASGIHPFTLQPIDPIRVLVVDLENSDNQTRRKLKSLRVVVNTRLEPDQLHIICRVEGLDLTQPADELWLSNLVAAHRADLLITGPLYKLAAGNPNDEKDAKPAAYALDRIRANHRCAMIIEAHSKKAEGVDPKKRSKEPFGWSGWLRWPEFGYHLAEDGTFSHWRGPRDVRTFPTALNRGGVWPWTPSEASTANDNEARWQAIRRVIWQAGRKLSEREIANATGLSRSTVQRVLGQYAMQHAAVLSQLELEDR